MTEDESSDEGEDESDDDDEDEDESSDEEQPQQQAAAAAPKVGVRTLSVICIPSWGLVWLGKQGRMGKNIDRWFEQSINIH